MKQIKERIYLKDGTEKDFVILVGQNSKENEEIINQSHQNDLWFHFESLSGPHLILQCKGEEISKRSLNRVGQMLWDFKEKVPKSQHVIYTEVKNVKLTEKEGAVITKKTKILKF